MPEPATTPSPDAQALARALYPEATPVPGGGREFRAACQRAIDAGWTPPPDGGPMAEFTEAEALARVQRSDWLVLSPAQKDRLVLDAQRAIAAGWTRPDPPPDRVAPGFAALAERFPSAHPGVIRTWHRGSVHRIRMTDAHRIISCEPGTRTLVLRGRKTRRWGFYLPAGWLDQTRYDYDARRPCSEVRS